MKPALKLLAGFTLFVFLVFSPLRANLIASVATHPALDKLASATLLETATEHDPCNWSILEKLGDAWFMQRQFMMAARAYGRGLTCSPGAAVFRFKYGESILGMGFIQGRDPILDALKLEPHDPIIQNEVERTKAFQ